MVELADHQQCVGPDALAQHDVPLGRAERRPDFDQVVVGNAKPPRRLRVHDDAAVAGNVVGHFLDHLDAGIAAPGILHGARRDQPEGIIVNIDAKTVRKRLFPQCRQIAPFRQWLIFAKLLVPPRDIVLVQAAAELGADAQKLLLIGDFEAQALGDEIGIEIPVQPRIVAHPLAVLAIIVEALAFRSVGQLRTSRTAHGVPDFLNTVRLGRIKGEIPALAAQLNARRAAVDGGVVVLKQAGAARQFRGDPGEIARLALRRAGRVAQGESLIVPELLDIFGAADADQLQAFQVGAVGQQHVGHVVGLVVGIGERHGERKTRHGV